MRHYTLILLVPFFWSCANPNRTSGQYHGTTQSIEDVGSSMEGQTLSSDTEAKLRDSGFAEIYAKLLGKASLEPLSLGNLTLPSLQEQLADAEGAFENLDDRYANFGEFLDDSIGDSPLSFHTKTVNAIFDPAARAKRKALATAPSKSGKKTSLLDIPGEACYTQGETEKQQTVGYCIGRVISSPGTDMSMAQSMCASVGAPGIQDAAAEAACVTAPEGSMCEVDVNGTIHSGASAAECDTLNQYSGQVKAQKK